MKTIITFGLALFLTIAFQSTADAQISDEGDFTVGVGVGFGSAVGGWGGGEPGIGINGYYGITEDIRAGLGFIYYLVGESDFSSTEINIDGHYIFKNEDDIVLYGLGGISYGTYTWNTGFGNISASTTGINLGGGVEFDLGNIALYAEPKVTVGGFGQFNITGGIRLRF